MKSRNPLIFSWEINWRWVIMLSAAILPGLLASILSNQLLWLVASFLAVLYASSYSLHIASSRIIDVVIGVFSAYLFIHVYFRYVHKFYNRSA